MIDDFLIKYHPWKLLKESSTFPNEQQLVAMKKVMDGEGGVNKKDLAQGMKTVGVKNLYELIVWGLKTGVIRDEPINLGVGIKQSDENINPLWSLILKYTVSGYSDYRMDKEVGINPDSLKYYKNLIRQKYNLGNSNAKFIRFAFQTMNPIKPPATNKLYRPYQDKSTLKYPPVLSKFRPANVDPNIPVYDYSDRHTTKQNDYKRKHQPIPQDRKLELKPLKTTRIHQALELLGVDKHILYSVDGKATGHFWDRSPEYLWKMLELAERRYQLEIAHAHPDKPGGDFKRAAQINAAWALIQRFFAKHGYKLH